MNDVNELLVEAIKETKKLEKWCFTIGIYNSKKIGIVGLDIGYAVLLSVLGSSIAPIQL